MKKIVIYIGIFWILILGNLYIFGSIRTLGEPIVLFGEGRSYLPRSADSSQSSPINISLTFNQTAFVPGADVKVNLSIYNNYSSPLTTINVNSDIGPDLSLISGSLSNSIASLAPNASWSDFYEVELPITASSLDVVFLIDGSGSMSEEISQVKDRVIELINTLKNTVSTVRVGFIMFGSTHFAENPYDDPRNVLDLTENTDTITSFITPWSAGGAWEPWGDALHFMLDLSWESTARLAILITDEPCNEGYYIGSGKSTEYYSFDDEMYNLLDTIKEYGIFISAMQCFGGGEQLADQLKTVSSETNGQYTMLSSSSSELMEIVLSMCEYVIQEAGQKIIVHVTAFLGETSLTGTIIKYILVDNSPPSIEFQHYPVFLQTTPISLRYRLVCRTYDAAGVDQILLFYKFNTTTYLSVWLNETAPATFDFLFPEIAQGIKVYVYVIAIDILGNSFTSPPYSFIIDYDISNLPGEQIIQPTLGINEILMFRITTNLTLEDHILLVAVSEDCNCTLVEEGTTNFLDFSLTQASNFHYWNLKAGSHYLISLVNLASDTNVIKIAMLVPQNYSIPINENALIPESLLFTAIKNTYLYRITADIEQDTGFYCTVDCDDDYQFFLMMVFTNSTVLKSHVFNKISIAFTKTTEYYILIALLDRRVDTIQATAEIGYGIIDDDPYWTVEANTIAPMGIASFPWIFLLGGSICAIFGLWRMKRQKIHHF